MSGKTVGGKGETVNGAASDITGPFAFNVAFNKDAQRTATVNPTSFAPTTTSSTLNLEADPKNPLVTNLFFHSFEMVCQNSWIVVLMFYLLILFAFRRL